MTPPTLPNNVVLSTDSFFKVDIGTVDGKTVGTFRECSGLEVEWEVHEYAEGGENRFVHKLRGRAKHPNLVLKRGVTRETALLDWFLSCQDRTQRHDLIVSLCDNTGTVVRSWSFAGAWPVKWHGPTLNAGGGGLATESLEIAHDGFSPQS
jgi:phage tail-like protein